VNLSGRSGLGYSNPSTVGWINRYGETRTPVDFLGLTPIRLHSPTIARETFRKTTFGARNSSALFRTRPSGDAFGSSPRPNGAIPRPEIPEAGDVVDGVRRAAPLVDGKRREHRRVADHHVGRPAIEHRPQVEVLGVGPPDEDVLEVPANLA
jgi:hypothetical protein